MKQLTAKTTSNTGTYPDRPTFSFRPGTTDSSIYTQVLEHNEYRLPRCYRPNDVIIDIGAHIGSFSLAVLQRGATKVFAFEADPENCKCASENLKTFLEHRQVYLSNRAVWRSDTESEAVFHGGYSSEPGNLINTGGGGVLWAKEGKRLATISLDDVLIQAAGSDTRGVRLLKIDCEGAEWPILLTSSKLHLVREICGEFHEIGGKYNSQSPPLSIPGYSAFTISALSDYLRERGFHFTYHRSRNLDGRKTHCGLFFATRASVYSLEYFRFMLRLNLAIRARSFTDGVWNALCGNHAGVS